ncbi:MAG: S1 family peptidase [Acidimicrobiales bacterium]
MSTSVRSGSKKQRRPKAGNGDTKRKDDQDGDQTGTRAADGQYRLDRDGAARQGGSARRVKSVSADRLKAATGRRDERRASTATEPSAGGPALRAWFRGRFGTADRVGGVAPFVPPKSRLGRRMRLREWGQRGFVQLSPGRQKLRHRILPRTVIGIAFMLTAAGIGAAFSGAAFYAYYDDRLAENERTVARFVEGFDQQFTDASGALDDMRTDAVSTIRSELAPLETYVDDARGVINLPAVAGPSVWLVETRDEQGRLSNGSAFAIVGHQGGTALVTSYSVVVASASSPGPGIDLLKGSERIPAQLWAWDAQRDLALLVVDRQIPILDMAGENAQIQSVGGPVFAISGFGGQGATASPGVLLDHSQIGLQHTAPVGTLFAGGPLVDGQGRVVGMASTAYSPMGIDPGDVRQAPDVQGICTKVLRCSEVEEELSVEAAGG